MENKRIVDINIYWAEVIRDTAQFGQIAVAENPEFNRLSECIFRALEDSFIHSGSEYTVKRWEKMLQIAPSAGETLEERKARILTYLNLKLPYTWRVLKQLIEGIVGEGKVSLDCINDEGKLVVHTDRISDEKSQVVTDLIALVVPENLVIERYNHNIEISWRDINKYATCTNLAQMKAVNADFANDLTSEGEWVYPLPELVNCAVDWGQMVFGDHKTQHGRTRLKKWCVPLPKLKYAKSMFRYCEALENEVWELPSLTYSNFCMFDNALKNIPYIKIILPSCTEINHLFHYGATKAKHIVVEGDNVIHALSVFPYMTNIEKIELNTSKLIKADGLYHSSLPLTDFPLEYPALSTAPRMLMNCQITGYQAITILNSIPTWTDGKTHEITLGIHIDYQNDAEVLAAIENAKNKGWTVTVQWNGTPTSGISTLDLEEIYARVTESEYGDYTDENGTRCYLDWGHYVTDTTDYKLFFSIYEAEQYFKLTKIEGIEQ